MGPKELNVFLGGEVCFFEEVDVLIFFFEMEAVGFCGDEEVLYGRMAYEAYGYFCFFGGDFVFWPEREIQEIGVGVDFEIVEKFLVDFFVGGYLEFGAFEEFDVFVLSECEELVILKLFSLFKEGFSHGGVLEDFECLGFCVEKKLYIFCGFGDGFKKLYGFGIFWRGIIYFF